VHAASIALNFIARRSVPPRIPMLKHSMIIFESEVWITKRATVPVSCKVTTRHMVPGVISYQLVMYRQWSVVASPVCCHRLLNCRNRRNRRKRRMNRRTNGRARRVSRRTIAASNNRRRNTDTEQYILVRSAGKMDSTEITLLARGAMRLHAEMNIKPLSHIFDTPLASHGRALREYAKRSK
jgi:hypothetical protein